MSLRDIYQQLGMEAEYEKEIVKFNHRILLVLEEFESRIESNKYSYERIRTDLVKEFGFLVGKSDIYNPIGEYYVPLKNFFAIIGGRGAFQTNILNLTLLLEASKMVLYRNYRNIYDYLLSEVKRTFEATSIDIGYFFNGKTVIKQGARELDEKLILDTLTWLSKYPAIRQSFEACLKDYLKKEYPDAITNAYASLEGLVKTFLGKDKQLDNDETRKNLINKLGLDGNWGQLLYNYSKLAHEFSSRHGKKETGEKLELAAELVEFYIYITGTFMRLILTLSAESNSG